MRDAAHVERFMACDEQARAPATSSIPEWLVDTTRPSARVMDALRAARGQPLPDSSGFEDVIENAGRVDGVA